MLMCVHNLLPPSLLSLSSLSFLSPPAVIDSSPQQTQEHRRDRLDGNIVERSVWARSEHLVCSSVTSGLLLTNISSAPH